MPQSVFDELNFCPTPVPDVTGSRYKTFNDSYGTIPSDDYRPGKINTAQTEKVKKPPFALQHFRKRFIINCLECLFPRLIYTQYKLSKDHEAVILDHIEDYGFICGTTVDLQNVDIPKIYTICTEYYKKPVSSQYYQLKDFSTFKSVCANCLSENVNASSEKQPLCSDCKGFTTPATKKFKKK